MQPDMAQLGSQLEERKRNLKVIDECIEADTSSSQKLTEVRDFLVRRIRTLEEKMAQGI